MKKILITALVVIVAITVVFAIYRFNFRKSVPTEGSTEDKVLAIFQQNDCFACHSSEAQAPFYGSFPIIGQQVLEDMNRGTRYLDLSRVDLANINEADLAKIEQTMLSESMPLAKYKAMHWGTGFNKAEKSLLASWIMQTRAKRFATGLAADQYSNHPLQPMIDSIPTHSAKVSLGNLLYHDARLSLDNTVSCATCHPLDKGGVDGLRTSEGIDKQLGGINAPTVYNAVFNHVQFWNGRAANLAEQAAGPPANPIEMGNQTWDDIVERLRKDPVLVAQFNAIYGENITEANVTDAIAEFEKTLITPNSPFDNYLKGDKEALTAEQIEGFDLFMAHNCASCHVGQALGGQSFEHMGIVEDYHAARKAEKPHIVYNDDDKGLYGFTNNELDLHKYKVPTLRNIALTSPYMHDGSVETLTEAVKTMMRFQTGTKQDQEEINKIVMFMETLTGEHQYLNSQPSQQ